MENIMSNYKGFSKNSSTDFEIKNKYFFNHFSPK